MRKIMLISKYSFSTKDLIKKAMSFPPQKISSNFKILTEGNVNFITEYTPENGEKNPENETTFYNPVQVFNRDISLLVTYTFAKILKRENPDTFEGIQFYDALSASG